MLAVKSENPESSRGVPVVVHCIEDGNDDVDLGAACHDDSVQVKTVENDPGSESVA